MSEIFFLPNPKVFVYVFGCKKIIYISLFKLQFDNVICLFHSCKANKDCISGATLEWCTDAKNMDNFEDFYKLSAEIEILKIKQF